MSAYCGVPLRCVLSLPGRVLDLMDAGQGFRLASLDLGYPTVREDANDSPDQSGSTDNTRLFSSRAVTIAGSIVASATGSRSASIALLAPFMNPAARPVLTYQLDADAEPRTLVLRAADLSAPLNSLNVTAWSAQWKAPGALANGLVEHSAMCGPSFLIVAGRKYDLAFDRVYPASLPASSVVVVAEGDYPTPPVFTITGPATGASITVADDTAGTSASINLQDDYTVPAGHYLVIDCGARTIVDDTGANVYGDALDTFATWPTFIPGNETVVSFLATGTAASTSLAIAWFDRWLI